MWLKVYSANACANLKALLKETDEGKSVIIRRRGAEDVALISADELRGLVETAHLLRSPKNARRLLRALRRAASRKLRPQSLQKFRSDLALVQE